MNQGRQAVSSYRRHLEVLRRAFPQPVSDQEHDAWFVFSMLRALDQLDSMKSERPILGEPAEIDFRAASDERVPEEISSVEDVSRKLVAYFSGMFIWGHPRSQINVIPPPCIPGIMGTLLPAIYNPNICSEEGSRRVALAEAEAIAMTAELMGYSPREAGGVFTFGGTGTLLYAIRTGVEKCCPGSMRSGLSGQLPVIICSDEAHYACCTAASWLGLGTDQIVRIPTAPDNEMRACLLESELRRLLREGRRVACIVATMGTTDAFGLDPLRQIREIRDELAEEFSLDYVPHLHADAVIGWAWSVFRDYDLSSNDLQFPDRTTRALAWAVRRIKDLHLADSIGVDYHKTGFVPYISSAILFRDAADLQLLARTPAETPYLFQSGEYHPGRFTLETSRSGAGPLAALAAFRLFGRTGLRTILGHLVSMAELLRDRLQSHPAISVVNPHNFGPVTLFRVYPPSVDTFEMPQRELSDAGCADQLKRHNDYNRRIFELIHEEALRGEGVVLSMTECWRESEYGHPVCALKSYIMSPFSDEQYVQAVLDSINRAQKIVESGSRSSGDE